MYRSVRVVVLLFLVVGFVSLVQAQSGGLPDYVNWPKSFHETVKISFQGVEVDAHLLLYFNNELPREASQIVGDLTMEMGGETQRFVQYVVVRSKNTEEDFVNFDVELYQEDADKMLLRGAANLTMSTKEFYKNILLPEKKSPAQDASSGYYDEY